MATSLLNAGLAWAGERGYADAPSEAGHVRGGNRGRLGHMARFERAYGQSAHGLPDHA